MTTELRVVIYQSNDTYVAQCLEHDLCVQGRTAEDIRISMDRQISFYNSKDCEFNLSDVKPAPQKYLTDWDNSGDESALVSLDCSTPEYSMRVKMASCDSHASVA